MIFKRQKVISYFFTLVGTALTVTNFYPVPLYAETRLFTRCEINGNYPECESLLNTCRRFTYGDYCFLDQGNPQYDGRVIYYIYHTDDYDQAGPPPVLANGINNGLDKNYTCHPVNIASGNKFFSENLYTGSGINPLKLESFYNSNSKSKTWTHSYTQSLRLTSDTIRVVRPNGQITPFTIDGGAFTADSQRSERLISVGAGYQLRLPNNTLENYNEAGQLISIVFPSGIAHGLTYTADTITINRLNESMVLTIVDGNVTRAVLPDNSQIDFSYDDHRLINHLLTTQYADGSVRNYLYENTDFPSYVTGIVDENGNRISSVEYDSEGRAISSEVGMLNSGIERTEIEYHADGTRTVTNSLGKQNTYHFTEFNGEYKMTQVEGHASANCAAANQAYTYDANGFMASKTDWKGNVTTYVHNDRGLETSRTEASGTAQARTITTEWHPTFNLRTTIMEPERETVMSYDDQGRLTSQEVNPR